MKVLFLDVDGVLCLNGLTINKDCLSQLVRIINSTQANIVLSSSWRLAECNYNHINKILTEVGLSIYSKTDDITTIYLRENSRIDLDNVERHLEISDWLKLNDVESYVIIDDDVGAAIPNELQSYFRTYQRTGLTEEIADAIILYMNKE